MKKIVRDKTLDALKGIALILMLLAHAENLFNNGNNEVLSFVNTIGTSLAFTIFLFASGVGASFSLFKPKTYGWAIFFKLLKRALIIYLVYLALNIVYVLLNYELDDVPFKILGSAILNDPKVYTEFLIPLIFIPFVGLVIRKIPEKFFKNIWILATIIAVIYICGAYVATLNLPIEIEKYTSLLFGSFSRYRFPIIQYSIIYIIGLRFGLYWTRDLSLKIKTRDVGQMLIVAVLLLTTFAFTNSAFPSEYDLFRRWPPGMGFMLQGLIVSFATYYIALKYPKLSTWKLLSYLGLMSLFAYVVHILWVYIYKGLINYQFNSVILAVSGMLSFIMLNILLGFLYISLNKKIDFKIKTKPLIVMVFMVVANLGLIVGMVYAEAKEIKLFNVDTEKGTQAVDIDREPNLFVSATRIWVLKNTKIPANLTSTQIKIGLDNKLRTGRTIDVVIESNGVSVIRGAEKVDEYNYKLDIFSDAFQAGQYNIHALMSDKPSNTSNTIKINISYPLFMTWTLDYEGYDVTDKNLQAMASFSDRFQMPLTHLFNPRIFVANDVSKSRADYLVRWVLERQNKNGDEIGLHLHMHCDMLLALGMEPKTEPRWGGRDNCHDVLTYAYNYDEFKAIIYWAKDMFRDKGLPVPTTYRAGGWFIAEPQLQVLQDMGFKMDTSGRTEYKWGVQKGPWYLTETTKPYHPSTRDQNKSTPEPTLTLWELPNNGWDSTNNKVEVLKKAFDLNYTGAPLTTPQVLTYMSHPHWFVTYDQKRVDELLTYTGQFKAIDDNGPVIYLTSNQALDYWE